MRLGDLVTEGLEEAGGRVESVQARFGGTDPIGLGAVSQYDSDAVARQAAGVIGIVLVAGEPVGLAVPARQPAALGADPDISRGVFGQGENRIVGQRGRIVAVAIVGQETVAVVAVQAVLGAHPDEAGAILQDAEHRALREPLFDGQAIESHGRRLSSEADGEK